MRHHHYLLLFVLWIVATPCLADPYDLIRSGDRALEASLDEDALEFYRQALLQAQAQKGSLHLQGRLQQRLADVCRTTGRDEAAKIYLKRSVELLSQAFDQLVLDDLAQAGEALSDLIAAMSGATPQEAQKALLRLDAELERWPDLLVRTKNPDQLLALRGKLLSSIPNIDPQLVSKALSEVSERYPNSPEADASLYLLGTWHYQRRDYAAAEPIFLQLRQRYPKSRLAAQALYWAGRSAEQTGREGSPGREHFKRLYSDYPTSPFAAEAYFHQFFLEDYTSDNIKANQHLDAMAKLYPNAPYLVLGHYLQGLKIKRERLLSAPRRDHRKSWIQAIEAFQNSEILFDALHAQGAIPSAQLDYFAMIRHRAALERAQANLAIASSSVGAKRQIYLEYAITAFQDLLEALDSPTHPLVEEGKYGLAQAYLQTDAMANAAHTCNELIDNCRSQGMTRGYYLSRAHSDLATLAIQRGEYAAALEHLNQAEEAAKGKVLSDDERLTLWIQRSVCQRTLGDLDAAMRQLSRVINDDTVSGLRLKAMLLRAEIYEQQGRPELAQKQLTALLRTGGEWSNIAREKLEKEYGYH